MEKQEAHPNDPTFKAAMKAAREVVRMRWPEFAEVDPQVSQRAEQELHASDAERLGTSNMTQRANHAAEYTFTFTREIRTPEGYTLPRIARVTVDSYQHVVKAVVSK